MKDENGEWKVESPLPVCGAGLFVGGVILRICTVIILPLMEKQTISRKRVADDEPH